MAVLGNLEETSERMNASISSILELIAKNKEKVSLVNHSASGITEDPLQIC